NLDERKISIYICDELMAQCQELAPAVVLFFSPPYNPAINSSEDSLVQQKIVEIQEILHNHFQTDVKQVHFFNSISDVSNVNYKKFILNNNSATIGVKQISSVALFSGILYIFKAYV